MVNIPIIDAKFRRSKILTKYTFLWNDLSEEKKKIFDISFLNQKEQIIICFKERGDNFYYLTNLGVITKNYKLFYSDIEFINIVGIEENKESITELLLCSKIENNYLLKLEQGTWATIYDVLKLLIKQSTK